MNIVTIDPSLSCTAMIVNDKKFIYVKSDLGHTKGGSLAKWFSICNDFITYRWIDRMISENHSEQEILKLIEYDKITDEIIKDILENVNSENETIVAIEGYSYSSAAGPLIDLVTFSSQLRRKLFYQVSSNIKIYQPSELKLEAAKLTYEPIVKGVKSKKYEYRNNSGVAGGAFKKRDMYKALIDNKDLDCDWIKLLREYQYDCLSAVNIPKPIEDMNDAKLMYEIILSKN